MLVRIHAQTRATRTHWQDPVRPDCFGQCSGQQQHLEVVITDFCVIIFGVLQIGQFMFYIQEIASSTSLVFAASARPAAWFFASSVV